MRGLMGWKLKCLNGGEIQQDIGGAADMYETGYNKISNASWFMINVLLRTSLTTRDALLDT